MTLPAIFITLVFIYSLVSRRLERTVITAPMVFAGAGMLTTFLLPEREIREGSLRIFLHAAEAGLVLLLFTDASRTDLRVLRSIRVLPVRLLSTGMLLTMLLGGLFALVIFPQLSIWEAGILAAILAPTDAGLGQIIVNSPKVPMNIRQALNVEAGLNDGLSVPFLLFFIALANSASPAQEAHLVRLIIEQLGYGAALGAGIGLVGGWLLSFAQRREWMAEPSVQLGVVALPLLCALASETAAASMFIAAFVAGLAVQVCFREAGRHSVEFAEDWGQFVNFSVFLLFGMLVARAWGEFNLSYLLYAVLSLTLIRMIPVALALFGTRLSRSTVLFMGWFGPRGLASIVLGLVYLEHGPHPAGGRVITLAVMMTVLLSIFAHGISALPGIRLYAAKMAALEAGAPELQAAVPAKSSAT